MIRITGGELGGRMIRTPSGNATRPTSAIARQALCNILSGQFVGARILDLFAGTGVVSFEWLSRGALEALQVEQNRSVVQLLRQNARDLGLDGICKALQQDVLQLLENSGEPLGRFDLIYADPPFTVEYPDLRKALSWLKPEGRAIFEMPSRTLPAWSEQASSLRKYGESTLAFF